ncbi:VOC family protein [Paenibacillus aurantiacus]|uniref:VOC family protein n=1 Tax=Paenibacillus aurantiacus TaxID=1936118 RepID=A0ABV5KK92_9BACL
MAELMAYIFCDNAREQADYYARILNGEIVTLQTYGELAGSEHHDPERVEHIELHAAGVVLYMADMQGAVRGNALELVLEFASIEEAGRIFESLAEGSSILVPFTPMYWGRMHGRLIDRYGVGWQITSKVLEAGRQADGSLRLPEA